MWVNPAKSADMQTCVEVSAKQLSRSVREPPCTDLMMMILGLPSQPLQTFREHSSKSVSHSVSVGIGIRPQLSVCYQHLCRLRLDMDTVNNIYVPFVWDCIYKSKRSSGWHKVTSILEKCRLLSSILFCYHKATC